MNNTTAHDPICKNEDALIADIIKGSMNLIELARAHFSHASPGTSLRALARWYQESGAETIALLRRLQADQAEIVAARARIAAIERLLDLARANSQDKKDERQACADLLKSCAAPRPRPARAHRAPVSAPPPPLRPPPTDDEVRDLLARSPMHPLDGDEEGDADGP